MVELTELSNLIYFQLRKIQYDSITANKRLGIFHVTDYVKSCMRNAYYSHLKSGQRKSMDTATMSIFFGGEAVHVLLDKFTKNGQGETPFAYNFIEDKKVELYKEKDGKKIVNPELKKLSALEWMQILIGESDALYKVEIDGKKEWVIVDYKTWMSKGFPLKAIKEDHKFQVNEYRYLFKKALDIDVKYGAVAYFDYGDRFAKPKIFTTELQSIDATYADLLIKYQWLKDAQETGKLPPRVRSWMCDGYCPHTQRCVDEEELSKEENELVINL